MKTNIPWSFLKQTPPGSKGLIPGVGMRYIHRPADGIRCEQIHVDVGTGDWQGRAVMRILRDRSKKSGWSRPDLVSYDWNDFE